MSDALRILLFLIGIIIVGGGVLHGLRDGWLLGKFGHRTYRKKNPFQFWTSVIFGICIALFYAFAIYSFFGNT